MSCPLRGALVAFGRVEGALDVVARGGNVGLGVDMVDSMQLSAAAQQGL